MIFEKEVQKIETDNVSHKRSPLEVVLQIGKMYKLMHYWKKRIGKFYSMVTICKILTNEETTRDGRSQLRANIIALGNNPKSNNNMPLFEDEKLSIALVRFANISDDCKDFTVIELDTSTLNNEDYKLYQYLTDYKESMATSVSSNWDKYMSQNKLKYKNIPYLSTDPKVVSSIEPMKNIHDKLIDFENINEILPDGAYLIEHIGSPYFYIKNETAYRLVLRGIAEKIIDNSIAPYFLKAYEDTTVKYEPTEEFKRKHKELLEFDIATDCIKSKNDESLSKEDFYLLKNTHFESDTDFISLVTENVTAYYYTVKFGIHQKFHQHNMVNGKDVSLYSGFFEDISFNIDGLISLIDKEDDVDALQYILEDVKRRATVLQQDTLVGIINSRITKM